MKLSKTLVFADELHLFPCEQDQSIAWRECQLSDNCDRFCFIISSNFNRINREFLFSVISNQDLFVSRLN